MEIAEIAQLIAGGVFLSSLGYGAKAILSQGNRLTKLEAVREPMAEKLDTLCRDVKEMDRKLATLIGKQQSEG